MGSTWQVQWFDDLEHPASRLQSAIEHELAVVIEQMSHWLPTSHLSRLQGVPAGQSAKIPPELCQVLECALRIARETNGAYDPTLGQLVAQWGFGPHAAISPPFTMTKPAQSWQSLHLDVPRCRLRHDGNLSLDLSAIAKGFAVDQLARLLHRSGIDHYLIEIGGELRAAGLKDDRQPWWVELEPPGRVPFPPIRIALSGWSVATSGDYRQRRQHAGRQWSHTIDPRTGSPADNNVASATVLHEDCIAADAYSTALLVMGITQGLDFADQMGLAALLVERGPDELVLHASRMLREMI